MEFTPEMIEKARSAASPEELAALAKENNLTLSAEEAASYFEQLNPKTGELDDDDLETVSGGGCGKKTQSSNKVYDIFNKWPYVTYVYHNGWQTSGTCPNCIDWGTKHFNHEFNFYWSDESHTRFHLYCVTCGYKWEAGSFRGDPRTHGIQLR